MDRPDPGVSPTGLSTRALVFEGQAAHLFWLALLVGGILLASRIEGVLEGAYLGLSTETWLWLAILSPVGHQLWVWLCWRGELHAGWLSRHLGPAGFRIYAVGFALWSAARFFTVIAVSESNRGSLALDHRLLDGLALLAAIPAVYLFYSVARYFGFSRALGADHFDVSYREKPFVRRGIFRFTRNGMYTYGFLILWIPGLLAGSKAGLLAALFNHLYIWVHYSCTELPDMRRIYALKETP